MASIGRTHHIKCKRQGCGKRAPYWSDFCKTHRTPIKMKTETNWEQYDNVALAVLIHSTESGWIEVARWNDTNRPAGVALREAREKFNSMDGKKMLLNFGFIIAESNL